MKKSKLLSIGLSILSTFFLVGCCTPMHELTQEEEVIIVDAVADIVSKYNMRQTDGMNWATLQEETQEESESAMETETETESQSPTETESQETQKQEETQQQEEQKPQEVVKEISIPEAMGYQDQIEIVFQKMSIEDYYAPNVGFVVNPVKDNHELIILEFNMRNLSDKDIELDMTGIDLQFLFEVEDLGRLREQGSFSSFTKYINTLSAGEQEKILLFFEIEKGHENKIKEPNLILKKDNISYSVKL